MRILAYLFLTWLLAGGEEAADIKSQSDPPIVDPNGKPYFPENLDNWYPKHLLAMKEPSLFSLSEKVTGDHFRLLCLPSFSKPICFRAFVNDGNYVIRVVRLNGRGGYEPGKIELDAEIEITEKEWNEHGKLVTQPFGKDKITEEEEALLGGLDGTQWILEVQAQGVHQIQEVWGPEYWISADGMKVLRDLYEAEGDQYELLYLKVHLFHRVCNQLLVLSDFTVPERMNPPATE